MSSSSSGQRPPNRLAHETSPYLLQHAQNPVDWYPWGEEALAKARQEDKPIFLSIGYSACHWCHVMEHESFEDEGIAGQLARDWIAIKVDREERPDLDEIYMKAVQAMTGAGGWPMSVFLTPQLEPFFGGTYFPPYAKFGRPGFADVLRSLSSAWQNDRKKVTEQGAKMAEKIAAEGRANLFAELDPEILDASLNALADRFDETWGGFGHAPKFPHAMDLRILMRHWKRTGDEHALHMATFTMDRMAEGGVYDQLAGGFHRYSTDERWLIPHFEKMLYDNALLVPAYLEAFLITKEQRYARVASECCDWMLREMSTPEGGIASTQDADTEGVEGKFFVWTPDEFTEVLGAKRGARAAAYFGVTDDGNFEDGQSALWRHESESEVASALQMDVGELQSEMAEAKRLLLEARERRTKPGTDDKVLASWNGLAISALAQSYQVLEKERFLDAARRAANYVLTGMRQENGRLFATARHGRAHLNAYLDDYVFMIQALLDLFESDFDERWLSEALALTDIVKDNFEDPVNGGYYTTSDDHEELIARLKNPHDGALPSGSGVHALNLLRLAEITGESNHQEEAWTTLRSLGSMVNRFPVAFSQLLQAVDFAEPGALGIVISGPLDSQEGVRMLRKVRSTFSPQRIIVRVTEKGPSPRVVPIVEGREPLPEDAEARAFVCRDKTCGLPTSSAEDLVKALLER